MIAQRYFFHYFQWYIVGDTELFGYITNIFNLLKRIRRKKRVKVNKKGSSQFNHFTSIINYKTDLTPS